MVLHHVDIPKGLVHSSYQFFCKLKSLRAFTPVNTFERENQQENISLLIPEIGSESKSDRRNHLLSAKENDKRFLS